MKYCSNCGKELTSNSNFCSNCGANQNYQVNNQNYQMSNQNIKPVGNGKTIACMVLGIIAASWAFLSLLSLSEIETELAYLSTVGELIGFYIGYNLFSLPTGIVGLSLGLTTNLKNNKKTAGIILCTISLIVAFINLLVIITNY